MGVGPGPGSVLTQGCNFVEEKREAGEKTDRPSTYPWIGELRPEASAKADVCF